MVNKNFLVKNIFLGLDILIFLSTSCGSKCYKDEMYFTNLRSKYNILKIKKTNFMYENSCIYSTFIPNPNYFSDGTIGNFLFIKNGILNTFYLNKNCLNTYKQNHYKIQKLINSTKSKNLDPCDIIYIPLLDLDAKVNDTTFFFVQSFGKSNFWSVLQQKEYSSVIKDTVLKYVRKSGISQNQVSIYYITKKDGIVGMGIKKWGRIIDSLGYPFSRIPIMKYPSDTPQTSILKYIKNISM